MYLKGDTIWIRLGKISRMFSWLVIVQRMIHIWKKIMIVKRYWNSSIRWKTW